MNRRRFLLTTGAGISGSILTTQQEEVATASSPDSEAETQSSVDAVLSYDVTEGSNWDGELPDLFSDWMKWVVVSFDVEQGEVSMEDLWFRSRIDTGERYQPVSARTDDALENGIENRGSVLDGGSGNILYKAPTFAKDYTWNLSGLRRQTVEGENIQLEEPGDDFYGDVTVAIDVEVTQNSDVITPEAEQFRDEGQHWGIVSIGVVEGDLNVEDVWFRSELEAGNRRVPIDYGSNRNIKRGMRSRGEIKKGYGGHAVYLVSEDADDASWYTDEMRQSVTVVDSITVNGEFVRPNGTPAVGDDVSVFINSNDQMRTVTDSEGSFEIQLPQGDDFISGAYQIQYYRPRLRDESRDGVEGNWVDMYAGPQLDGTSDEDVGTIELPEGDRVQVRTIDEDGNIVENAAVRYKHLNETEDSGASIVFETGETGIASLNGQTGLRLSGTVDITASPPDIDRLADTTAERTITVDEPMTVDLTLPLEDGDGSQIEDPTQRVLQITNKNSPSELTQNDVTATITRFERGQSVNSIDINQDDVTATITLFERN